MAQDKAYREAEAKIEAAGLSGEQSLDLSVELWNLKSPKLTELPETLGQLTQLKSLALDDVLIIVEALDEKLFLAARNIPHIGMADVSAVDPVLLISYDKVVVTQKALAGLEAMFK